MLLFLHMLCNDASATPGLQLCGNLYMHFSVYRSKHPTHFLRPVAIIRGYELWEEHRAPGPQHPGFRSLYRIANVLGCANLELQKPTEIGEGSLRFRA